MLTTPKDIKAIDSEWTSMFHKLMDEILAPRGYEDHHSGKRIAKLEFLTEDRIKKVANSSKRLLDHFRVRLEADITTYMYNVAYENENILKELEKEKDKIFFLRDNDKVMEMEHTHYTNSVTLKILPDFIRMLSTTTP